MRRLFLCLLASGLPIACSSAPMDNGSKVVQSERWATPVKHDANLYRYRRKLYRSEQPVPKMRSHRQAGHSKRDQPALFFDRNE